jgi:hypothetical protein
MASPMTTSTITPMMALVPAAPTACAISSPRKYAIATYMPIQAMPATSAPITKSQNRTWKIPDTNAGIVTDAGFCLAALLASLSTPRVADRSVADELAVGNSGRVIKGPA